MKLSYYWKYQARNSFLYIKTYQYDIFEYMNMTLKINGYDNFGSLYFSRLAGILSFLCVAIAPLTFLPMMRK